MMTEQEFYDACSEFFNQSRNPIEGEHHSYLLVVATETDEELTLKSRIIDPGIPATIKGPPVHQTMAQQTVIFLNDQLKEPSKVARDMAVALSQMTQLLGIETLTALAKESTNGEDFARRAKAAVRKAL